MARAFAKEPWSREYFDRIKRCGDLGLDNLGNWGLHLLSSPSLPSAHQNHYEQFGVIRGTASLDGAGEHRLELDVMRDHTHGSNRNWRLMHRYGINNFTTESGMR